MKIDVTHRNWFIASVVILIAASALYVVYARSTPGGPQGDTWIGLGYGVVGSLLILFAGVLGARKKVLLLRIGSLTWWMRGHLWLGLLSLPMILFHGGFEFGGLLTTVLMWLLIIVVASGLLGAALQHFMPTVMLAETPKEGTYDQLQRSLLELRGEALELVSTKCGDMADAADEKTEVEQRIGRALKVPKTVKEIPGQPQLRTFYLNSLLPYLRHPSKIGSRLSSDTTASIVFDSVKTDLDTTLHETLDDLASICEEVRQKTRQGRLHRILHGWLLLHLPLSMALMLLMVWHIVMALKY